MADWFVSEFETVRRWIPSLSPENSWLDLLRRSTRCVNCGGDPSWRASCRFERKGPAAAMDKQGDLELLRSSGCRRGGPGETLGQCSNSCSKPPGKRSKSGRSGWLHQNFRTEIDHFRDFGTRCLRVRDREAPGSNPGPEQILNSKMRPPTE